MKIKGHHIIKFVCLLSILGRAVLGARKGARRKSVFERLEVAPLPSKRSSCPVPQALSEMLHRNITFFKDSLTTEVETRFKELTALIEEALQQQAACFQKEKEIKESSECKKASSEPTTTHSTRYEDSGALLMCITNSCKDFASRMLDMIDHSTDPCQDFYQYACGGVENDPHLFPEDPAFDANKRLQKKIEGLDENNPIMGSARTFYDVCLRWQQDLDSDESLQYAKELVRSVGWFLPIKSTIPINLKYPLPQPTNLTFMLATFMASHYTPFFDISLDPDASNKERFLPKISLSLRKWELSQEVDHLTCISNFDKKVQNISIRGGPSLDLNEEYRRYQTCKATRGLDKKLSRMAKAITKMNLLDYMNEGDRAELLVAMRQNTEMLLSDIGEKLGEQVKFRSTVLSKDYQVNKLKDISILLGNQINWEEFFQILTGKKLGSDQEIVVYHQKELAEILTVIGHEWNTNSRAVHNSLLMLWSERVYSVIVSPLEPPEKFCLEATKVLLPDISSALYFHSFPDVHLTRARRDMNTKVSMIKGTFSSMIDEISDQVEDIKLKIDKSVVNVGAFFDASSRNQSLLDSIKGMNLNSSHAYNMDFLLKRFRRLLYGLLDERANSPRAMWINGIVPFGKKGIYVHETNHMFLPFGTFVPPYFYYRKFLPEYITFGGIGHLVAEQFIRMVDGTGKEFNGENKTSLNIPSHLIASTECISDQLDPEFTLSDGNVIATYKTPIRNFKLNDVISFSGATALSWKAYLKSQHDSAGSLPSLTESSEDHLIWLGEKPLKPIKAYFLRVAQTQCSPSNKINLLEIMENENMLPRHKVNLVLRNDQLFSEIFQCPKSTPMNPEYKCSFLPYHPVNIPPHHGV